MKATDGEKDNINDFVSSLTPSRATMYKNEKGKKQEKQLAKDNLSFGASTKRYRRSMEDVSRLKKRLDCILARPGNSRYSSSPSVAKSRHLGMPKSCYAAEKRSVFSSTGSETQFCSFSVKRDLVSGSKTNRKRIPSSSSNQNSEDKAEITDDRGKLFMFKKASNGSTELNFARLSVDDVLHISPLRDEDYRGRIVLTSTNSNNDIFSREEHFLPGFKFADVNLHLNSSLVDKYKLRQALKTTDNTKKVKTKKLEIRLPSASYSLTDSMDSNSERPKMPYFLQYRHSKSANSSVYK